MGPSRGVGAGSITALPGEVPGLWDDARSNEGWSWARSISGLPQLTLTCLA